MILDTNALSAVADGNPSAVDVIRSASRIAVPVIVLGEFRFGIAQSRYRTSYEDWLREWIESIAVLDVDVGTSQAYAAIGVELKTKGNPIPTNDLWIAALSRQYSLPVLSRDRHFDVVAGLKRIEW